MHYAAEITAGKFPGMRAVLIGPRVTRWVEGLGDPAAHGVLTFERLNTLFQAVGIDPVGHARGFAGR